jgi:hypothetical protein
MSILLLEDEQAAIGKSYISFSDFETTNINFQTTRWIPNLGIIPLPAIAAADPRRRIIH